MAVDTKYVDTFELTRLGLEASGAAPVTVFSRLLEDLPGQGEASVDWSLKGERSASGQFFLHVRVKGVLMLECQRCLAPFEWRVDTQNRLQVVNTEAALDDDAASDLPQVHDPIERIVGSRRLDCLALVEDEIILALPYVPKHDICPAAPETLSPVQESDAVESRPSPFAALGELKKH